MVFDPAYHRRQFADHKATINGRVSQIEQDPGLSPQERRQRLEAVYGPGMARHRELKAAYDRDLESRRQELRGHAFGPGDDPPADYRRALTEAANAKDLEPLIRQADLAGDNLARRAALAAAFDRGETRLIDREGDDAAKEAVAFEREFGTLQTTQQRMADQIAFAAPSRPDGVSGFAGVF